MERLTEWTGYEWIPRQERLNGKFVGYKNCMKRLAEYENTGLTPDQIREIDRLYQEKCKELAGYKKLEDQGKLLKLPVAAGEKLYWISDEDEEGRKIKTIRDDITAHFIGISSDGNIYVSTYKLDEVDSVLDKLGTRWACATRGDAERLLEPEWKRRMLRTFLGSRGGDVK